MKYSIILPVRNGGEYVKECVNSILSQTIPDFQLHVLDNCSTDGTSEWVKSLEDTRIIVEPADRPLSIEENWARIKTIRKNEFITLIGHDDILHSDYLLTMDRLIEKHPRASLYQTHFSYIDSAGTATRLCKPMDEVQTAAEFLAFFLSGSIDTMGTGFMTRAVDYDEVGGIPPSYPNLLFADFELWINLTTKSYKATAVKECFSFRLHQSMTTTSPDIKFHQAYGKFITYLESLVQHDLQMEKAVRRYALVFIKFYTKGLAHRLLRTPIGKREGQTVAEFLKLSKQYADRLVPGNNFNPDTEFALTMARRIDSNALFRKSFMLFKKLYSKPVYS